MPARNITFNGVSNSFEWQVGNTTRFIKFADITGLGRFSWIERIVEVKCGKTIHTLPVKEFDRLSDEYHEWRKNK